MEDTYKLLIIMKTKWNSSTRDQNKSDVTKPKKCHQQKINTPAS